MKRLCFGTFFKVLCSFKHVNSRDKDVIGRFTCCIDPKCGYIKSEDYVINKVLTCKANVSDGRMGRYGEPNKIGNIRNISLTANRHEVANEIRKIINITIQPDKWGYCLAILFDIISEDDTIVCNRRAFKLATGKSREELIEEKNIDFADLLAGLLLYTIKEVKRLDEDCRQTIDMINDEYLEGFKDKAEEIEKRIQEENDINNNASSENAFSVYEGINRILLAFNEENKKEGNKFDFPPFDGPFEIACKINGNGSSLEKDIKSEVVDYFNFIKNSIEQISRADTSYPYVTWGKMHDLYEEVNTEDKSKEEIYYEIIKLIDDIIPDDNIIKKDVMYMRNLHRIVSYYVQLCAIFKKEKECVE